jgi:hypothetical protein
MKKCQAITKSGAECLANGAHIIMVWALNNVAYPQDKLPALYANHGWTLESINLCGAHRNVIVAGKPINITTSNTEVQNKPKEGNMTNSHEEISKAKADCPHCLGTGIDTGFWDACKCISETTEIATPDAATKPQLGYIKSLQAKVEFEVKISTDSRGEASEAIGLLKEVVKLKGLMESCEISDDRKAKIEAKLATGATKPWVRAQTNKILSEDLVSKIQQVMRVDLTWADNKVETIGLLKAILKMVQAIKAKKHLLTSTQIEYLREQINTKPTTGWVLAKLAKLNQLS